MKHHQTLDLSIHYRFCEAFHFTLISQVKVKYFVLLQISQSFLLLISQRLSLLISRSFCYWYHETFYGVFCSEKFNVHTPECFRKLQCVHPGFFFAEKFNVHTPGFFPLNPKKINVLTHREKFQTKRNEQKKSMFLWGKSIEGGKKFICG